MIQKTILLRTTSLTQATLGIIASEYEVTQLVQLLQTMGQDSPLYMTLVQSVIDNMNLSNREELLAAMQQAMQPNPEATTDADDGTASSDAVPAVANQCA